MCGIAGFLSFGQSIKMIEVIKNMGQSLHHRGPDSSGQWLDESDTIALAHQRLSILDLSIHGHQPMLSKDSRFVMVFNGEIYNHHQIRKLLEKEELIHWRGHSDTETLLQAFASWGIKKTLDVLVGMFAISLWDRETKKLYLFRDRMGEKPLYYGFINRGFVFASELKAFKQYPGFKAEINLDALNQYLALNYIPTPLTIYQNIFKLTPGTILEIGLHSDIKCESYWRLFDLMTNAKKDTIFDTNTALSIVKTNLMSAVAAQTLTDVPLGAFLSGGIDSSLIVALMQSQSSSPIDTFTIGFNEKQFDESVYAAEIAKYLGTAHHQLLLTHKECQDIIPMLASVYDEPFADSSQIPTLLVAKMAREKVTVALSGDGGDELFGGYNRYNLVPNIWNKFCLLPKPLRKLVGKGLVIPSQEFYNACNHVLPRSKKLSHLGQKVHKFGQRLDNINDIRSLYHSMLINPIKSQDLLVKKHTYLRHKFLNEAESPNNILDYMFLCDSLNYLPDDILTKVDRAAMALSLETRIPFLDHRVIESSWQLQNNIKIRQGKGKWILRSILQEYLPNSLIERPKMGFGVPIADWLRTDLKLWADDLLSLDSLNTHGLFDVKIIQKIWQQHQLGQQDWSSNLWNLCMFQLWYREHM